MTPRPAPLSVDTPRPTDPADWSGNAAYLRGHDLMAQGYYWEAHEVWEGVWMACRPNSPKRHLVQGLIQVANACLKIAMGRPAAAGRLLVLARFHCGEAAGGGESVMGLDPDRLARDLDRFAAKVRAGGAPEALLAVRPTVRPE